MLTWHTRSLFCDVVLHTLLNWSIAHSMDPNPQPPSRAEVYEYNRNVGTSTLALAPEGRSVLVGNSQFAHMANDLNSQLSHIT